MVTDIHPLSHDRHPSTYRQQAQERCAESIGEYRTGYEQCHQAVPPPDRHHAGHPLPSAHSERLHRGTGAKDDPGGRRGT